VHVVHRVESPARTQEIIEELRNTNVAERSGRAQDQEDPHAMEKLRRDGYM
jgi:sulfate adenylyltransferase subunit 2